MLKFYRIFLTLLLLAAAPALGAVVHTHSDAGSCGDTTHAGNMQANCNSVGVTSNTFTYTSSGTGNGNLFLLSCAPGANTPSAVTLTATGWTTTQVGSISGTTAQGFAILFKAYSPNTTPATFTVTWTVTGNTCGGFMNDLVDEFSGVDGTNFIDNNNSSGNTTGTCSFSITPVASNAGLWAACNDSVTAVGSTGACAASACTKGGDDTGGDWTEWKILSGQAGVSQTVPFTGSSGAWRGWVVTLTPAGGIAAQTMPPTIQ